MIMKLIARSIKQTFYAPILAFAVALSFMGFQNSTTTILDDSCPTSSFSILNNVSDTASPIIFNNESTGGLSYRWDFGDGNFSTAKSPAHRYGQAGTFPVKLTVISNGCTTEFIGSVDVIDI